MPKQRSQKDKEKSIIVENKVFQQQPSNDEVSDFVMNIQALNISGVIDYLQKYGNNITDRVQPRLRLPCIFFVVSQLDFNFSSFLLRQFIKFQANIHCKDLYNNNLLFYVCSPARIKMLKYLLHLGLNINNINIYGETIVHEVVKNKQVQILRYLQQSQFTVDVNIQDCLKRTPIFYAEKSIPEDIEMCRILVEMGAKAHIHDIKKHTPSYYAKKILSVDIINILQKAKKQELKRVNSHIHVKLQQVSEQCEEQPNSHTTQVQKTNSTSRTKSSLKSQSQKSSRLKSFIMSNKDQQKEKRWKEKVKRVITQIYNKQFSKYFQKEVDQQQYGIDDYYSIIQNPIDLDKISLKIKNGKYKNSWQFVNDINLLVDNCILYNGCWHFMTSEACKMKEYVDEQYL